MDVPACGQGRNALPHSQPLRFLLSMPASMGKSIFVAWLCVLTLQGLAAVVSILCHHEQPSGDKIPAWPDLPSSRFCATVSQVQGFQGWHFRSSFLLLCTKLDFWAHSVHLEKGWVHHLWDSVQNESAGPLAQKLRMTGWQQQSVKHTLDPSEPESCTVYTPMKLALPQDLRG